MKLTVCALTYRRPEGLRRLLDGFLTLDRSSDWNELCFVIVDNDPDCGGQDICDEFQKPDKLGQALTYINQPIQGIARSRNVALDAAEAGDWTAFIDDDEKPDPDWLVKLYESAVQHEADVVGGPVNPIIEGDPPAWIQKHGFFERRKYADGAELGHVFTNNVLFRSGLPKSLEVRFDERPEFAALRVGEDRLFFQSLAMRGAKTVYCDHAFVHEWIPHDRANEHWLVNRMYKIGVATAAVEKTLTPGPGTQLKLIAKGAVWSVLGLTRFICFGFASAPKRTKSRRFMAYGRGLIAG